MAALRFTHYGPKGKVGHPAEVPEAIKLLEKDGFLWIDANNPTREDLALLAEPLHLHALSIEDCLDDNQIPKLENFPNYTFILFNSYVYRGGCVLVDEIDFFVGQKFLITVHGVRAKEPGFYDQLEASLTRNLAEVTRGPDLMLHAVLDYIVDKKFLAIENLQEELGGLEETVLDERAEFKPEELLRLRRCLLQLRKSLFHEREVLIKLCRRDSPFTSERAIFPLRDVYDHLARFFEAIEINREMVTNLMELHLSLVNLRMTRVGNSTNRTMKRLTIVNTIFLPLSVLAGVGGMSEWSMITGPANWWWSYPLFFLLMGLFGWLNYWLLRWMDWIPAERERRAAGEAAPAIPPPPRKRRGLR